MLAISYDNIFAIGNFSTITITVSQTRGQSIVLLATHRNVEKETWELFDIRKFY